MRSMIDERAAFFNSVTLIVYIEKHLGITISDETVEAIRAWDELTLNDLATAVIRSDSSIPPSVIDKVLRSAVHKEFRDAPAPLDFNALLLDAIAKPRKYGGY